MSRSQQSDVIDTAKADNSTDQTAATDARTAATSDIGNYQAQLSKFAANNPYTEGGAFDTATDKELAGTADAGSAAIANQEGLIAKRSGMNAAAPAAIAAEAARANQRDLASAEAGSTKERIAAGAGYGDQVLSASAVPAQLEEGLYNPSLSAANGALGIEGDTAKTPGFWDTLGDSFASGLGTAAGKATSAGLSAAIGCWVAAELYGGWDEPRTVDVRRWIFGDFAQVWYGRVVGWVYLRIGERLARGIRRYPLLRRIFLPLFNVALRKARGI